MEILSTILLTILGIAMTITVIKEFKEMGEKTEELHHKEILLKNLEIENLMLEKEIKKEMKKQIENTKNEEEMNSFLKFLKRQQERIEKEIENVLEREDED